VELYYFLLHIVFCLFDEYSLTDPFIVLFVKQYSGQTEVVAGAYRDICLALLLESGMGQLKILWQLLFCLL